jgi:hypothetical protein
LIRRGGRYHIRVKVPAALRPYLQDRWEFTRSLGTSDLAEARIRCRVESVRIDALIEAARRKQMPEPVTRLSKSEVEYLARDWFHQTAEARRREHMPVSAPAALDNDDVMAEAVGAVQTLSNADHPA